MNVLLISANTETINMIPLPLGLNCVAVAIRSAGHDVHTLDLMGISDNDEQIRKAILRSNPALIGVSVRNVDNQHMAETNFSLNRYR